jgi:hypothetical protein
MNARRWILPAMFLPFVAVSAQVQQGVTGPSAATIAAKAKSAKLDQGHAKSAAINGKKFNIVPADFSTISSRDQLGDQEINQRGIGFHPRLELGHPALALATKSPGDIGGWPSSARMRFSCS